MRTIVVGVIASHIVFLIVLCYSASTPDLIIPKRFAVKTVSLKGEREVAPVATVATVAAVAPVAAVAVSAPAPTPAPVVVKKTAKTTPVKKAAPVVSNVKNQAIAKAKQALSNITKGTSKPSTTSIGTLSVEGMEEGDSYIAEVVAKLQKGLKLPEFGEVTVELTLEKSGKVTNCSIKDAKSLSNKMYVEKNLPSLKFPIFEGSLKHEQSHTFIFVLNSAMD